MQGRDTFLPKKGLTEIRTYDVIASVRGEGIAA
jgi:hypothetical protein